MAPVDMTYTARCPKCGSGYEGTDAQAFTAFTQEHDRHGVEMRSTARCSGCGASYEGTDKSAWTDFMTEHAVHGVRCAKCGEQLSFVGQVGTCPRCGKKETVRVTLHVERRKLGHTFFGR